MNQLPSETTFWSWAIRGLGGSLNILEGMLGHGPRLTESQWNELESELCRGIDLLEAAKNRITENAAAFHGPETDQTIAGSAATVAESAGTGRGDSSDGGTGSAGSDLAACSDEPASG
jgi:hypothetical protein